LPFEDLSEEECGLGVLLQLVADGACLEVGFGASFGVMVGGAEQQECFAELTAPAGDESAQESGVGLPCGETLELVCAFRTAARPDLYRSAGDWRVRRRGIRRARLATEASSSRRFFAVNFMFQGCWSCVGADAGVCGWIRAGSGPECI
jgi:hypothetical protein